MNTIKDSLSRRGFTAVVGVGAAGLIAPQSLLGIPGAQAQTPAPRAGAATNGDPLQTLVQEHRAVEQLIKNMLGTTNSQQRTELLMKLQSALNQHAIAEEAVIYPALRQIADGSSSAMEAVKDHADIQTQLFKLAMMPNTDDAWTEEVRNLQETITEHVKEEEQDWFPQLRQKASADQMRQIATLMQRAHSQCAGRQG